MILYLKLTVIREVDKFGGVGAEGNVKSWSI
jgi:hypothetical protein